jgi:hypothetical protein
MAFQLFPVFTSSDSLCDEMYRRMRRAGVNVNWDPAKDERKWIPDSFKPALVLDTAQPKLQHRPFESSDFLTLVFPFLRMGGNCSYWDSEQFVPYWVPIRIVPTELELGSEWGPSTVTEVLNVVGQYHDNGITDVCTEWALECCCGAKYVFGSLRVGCEYQGFSAYSLRGIALDPPYVLTKAQPF